MPGKTAKLNPQWVKETLRYFKEFLKVTAFPHPERHGKRGSKFAYPEWLIMFIAVLSVKAQAKNYLALHRLALQYWESITGGLPKAIRGKPISERPLRDRLQKICHAPRNPAIFIFQIFPRSHLA
jgi:hypothetical protein